MSKVEGQLVIRGASTLHFQTFDFQTQPPLAILSPYFLEVGSVNSVSHPGTTTAGGQDAHTVTHIERLVGIGLLHHRQ